MSQFNDGLEDEYLENIPYVETLTKPEGFFSDLEDASCTVKVVIRVRPINKKEERDKNSGCVTTNPLGLSIGPKEFNFDRVFDGSSQQEDLYNVCAHNLVLGCFSGYNATIIAYGQTGAGKTFTMGTGSTLDLVSDDQIGIVPRVFDFIIAEKENRQRQSEKNSFNLQVSFLELYGEELHDLLDPTQQSGKQITIREEKGQIEVKGLSQIDVATKSECLNLLNKGIERRVTTSNNMNEASSRSHAIFTITITQKIVTATQNEEQDGDELTSEENISAKFHFVDLAGSERIKKTGATGQLMKEGISINKGLSILGNVISALTAEGKQGFVPYRDSKLTRILQNSLGGNSRTTMIACCSPADSNYHETLSTLEYAARARNIKNKPKVNRDANSMLIEALKKQIDRLELENNGLRSLLKDKGVDIPAQLVTSAQIESTQKPQTPTLRSQQSQPQTSSNNINPVLQQEVRDLKIKLGKKEKEAREAQSQLSDLESKLSDEQKFVEELSSQRDDFCLKFEQIQEYLKTQSLSLPEQLSISSKPIERPSSSLSLKKTQSVPEPSTSQINQKKSILDEQKSIINNLKKDLQSRISELEQKNKKIAELQKKINQDETILKKQLSESASLKRQLKTNGSRKPTSKINDFQGASPLKEQELPDIDDMKSNIMSKLTTQFEAMFSIPDTDTLSDGLANECLDDAQNTSIEEKEKLMQGIRGQFDKFKTELGDLLFSSLDQNISQIKERMLQVEQEHRQQKTTKNDSQYRQKMEELQKQLDLQTREKSKKQDSLQKTMMQQENRIKSLESEVAKIKREKEQAELQKKYGEDRFIKLKATADQTKQEKSELKKNLTEKEKFVQKLKQDLKKTESEAQKRIAELQKIQKRNLDEMKPTLKRDPSEPEVDADDMDAIAEWIKLQTDALLNQRELASFLKDQKVQRSSLEEEMLAEGDRLTELMLMKERLEQEKGEIDDEGRQLEIDQELEAIVLDTESITQTLDRMEEHASYITTKIQKIEAEIRGFDPTKIQPPKFRGLSSVDMAKATLSTFFAVMVDLNVYKKDLENKCVEQDETIIELHSTINMLQDKLGFNASQKDQMMQRHKVMHQMVRKIGGDVEYLDQREVQEANLNTQEQHQLTKMSLSKIVDNLRKKLQDEESKNQRLNEKIDRLVKDIQKKQEQIVNIKREMQKTKTEAQIVTKVVTSQLGQPTPKLPAKEAPSQRQANHRKNNASTPLNSSPAKIQLDTPQRQEPQRPETARSTSRNRFVFNESPSRNSDSLSVKSDDHLKPTSLKQRRDEISRDRVNQTQPVITEKEQTEQKLENLASFMRGTKSSQQKGQPDPSKQTQSNTQKLELNKIAQRRNSAKLPDKTQPTIEKPKPREEKPRPSMKERRAQKEATTEKLTTQQKLQQLEKQKGVRSKVKPEERRAARLHSSGRFSGMVSNEMFLIQEDSDEEDQDEYVPRHKFRRGKTPEMFAAPPNISNVVELSRFQREVPEDQNLNIYQQNTEPDDEAQEIETKRKVQSDQLDMLQQMEQLEESEQAITERQNKATSLKQRLAEKKALKAQQNNNKSDQLVTKLQDLKQESCRTDKEETKSRSTSRSRLATRREQKQTTIEVSDSTPLRTNTGTDLSSKLAMMKQQSEQMMNRPSSRRNRDTPKVAIQLSDHEQRPELYLSVSNLSNSELDNVLLDDPTPQSQKQMQKYPGFDSKQEDLAPLFELVEDYLIGQDTQIVEHNKYKGSLWVLLSNMVILEIQISTGQFIRESDLSTMIDDCPIDAIPTSFTILSDEDQLLIKTNFGVSMLYFDEDGNLMFGGTQTPDETKDHGDESPF